MGRLWEEEAGEPVGQEGTGCTREAKSWRGACLRFMRANLGGQWDFDGCHLWRWVSWGVLDWEHPSRAGSGPAEVPTSDQETEEPKTRIVRHPVPTHSTTHCCPAQVPFCHWSAQRVTTVLAGPLLHPRRPWLLPTHEAVGARGISTKKAKSPYCFYSYGTGFLRCPVFLFDPLNLRLSADVLQLLWAAVGGNAS